MFDSHEKNKSSSMFRGGPWAWFPSKCPSQWSACPLSPRPAPSVTVCSSGHCTPEWKVIVEPHGPRHTAPWSLVPATAATITNCQWKSGCGDTGTLAGDRSNNPDTGHCQTKINGDHLHQQQTFLRPPNNNSQPYLHYILLWGPVKC